MSQDVLPFPEKFTCEHCGAKILEYRHNLGIGLVRGLRALYGKGKPSKLADLNLTLNQSNNFQKLQYWEFIEKVYQDGARVGGLWRITDKGTAFVEGRIPAPQSVWTFRGQRVRASSEHVYINNVREQSRQKDDYVRDAVAHQ